MSAALWDERPLGSVCEVIAGQSPESSAYNDAGEGLPFYQGKTHFTDRYLAPAATWTRSVTKRAQPRDILMSVRAPVGPINEATEEICIGRGLAAIRASSAVDRDFLWYALLWLQPKIVGNAGAVFPSINKNAIEALLLPLPPLQEQERIVAVLDQAFAALDRARINAEANLADAQYLFDSFLTSVFATRSQWPVEHLSARVRFVDYRGMTPPKSEVGVRLITAKNVRMGFIKDEPREFVPESIYEDWMTRGFPEFGDVLFTTEAPLANVAQLDTADKVVIGQRLITMQTDHCQIDPGFLKWSLISPQMQSNICSQGTGATVLGIKARLLKQIPIYVPNDIGVQKYIAKTCESAFAKKLELERGYNHKLSDLAALRQSLLQKAFAGELA